MKAEFEPLTKLMKEAAGSGIQNFFCGRSFVCGFNASPAKPPRP